MISPFAHLPSRVRIVEVGPRDGLQNEKAIIPTPQKIQFIQLLAAAGFPVVEATSFVSPRAVPQLSDADAVMAGLSSTSQPLYSVLVPNLKGMERALATGIRSVAVFTGASESFVRNNIHVSIDERLENFAYVVEMERSENIPVRGYVYTVFGCNYEGEVETDSVVKVVKAMLDIGVDEI